MIDLVIITILVIAMILIVAHGIDAFWWLVQVLDSDDD